MKSHTALTRTTQVVGALLVGGTFVALVASCAARVASLGLCCADDAYFASIAKNLAFGEGYGTTVHGEGFRLLDPEIGAGPSIIVPAAIATRFLGNRYWVPGLVAVTLWALLLVALYRALRGHPEMRHLGLACTVFLVGIFLLFPFHFEQWFALLGEVPAALLLLLGFVVLGGGEISGWRVALASLLCSLAVLSKLVSAMYCVPYFAALVVRVLVLERRSLRDLRPHALVAVAAFATPLLAFEAYKMAELGGIRAYSRNLSSTFRFVLHQGAPAASTVGRWTRAVQYDRAFVQRFGLSVGAMAVASLACTVLLLRRGGRLQGTVALCAGTGVVLGSIWYLLFSNGWPRYLVIAVVLFWALASLVLTIPGRAVSLALAGVLLVVPYALNRQKLPHVWAQVPKGIFTRSAALENALATTAFVDAHRDGAVFANQWWATTADLEYYSRSVDVFRRYTLVGSPGEFYAVFNRNFRVSDPAFDALVASCEPLEPALDPYALMRCTR
jgi:hypothetical protein